MNYSEYRKSIDEIVSLYHSISKIKDGESIVYGEFRYIRNKKGQFSKRSMTLYEWLKYLFYESKDKEVLKNLALSVFRSQIVIAGKSRSGNFFGIYSDSWQKKKEKKKIFEEGEAYASEYAFIFGSSRRKPNQYNLFYSGDSIKSIDNDVEIKENPLTIMFNYQSSLYSTIVHPMTGMDYFGSDEEFGLNKQAFEYILYQHIVPMIHNSYKGKITDIDIMKNEPSDDEYADIFDLGNTQDTTSDTIEENFPF